MKRIDVLRKELARVNHKIRLLKESRGEKFYYGVFETDIGSETVSNYYYEIEKIKAHGVKEARLKFKNMEEYSSKDEGRYYSHDNYTLVDVFENEKEADFFKSELDNSPYPNNDVQKHYSKKQTKKRSVLKNEISLDDEIRETFENVEDMEIEDMEKIINKYDIHPYIKDNYMHFVKWLNELQRIPNYSRFLDRNSDEYDSELDRKSSFVNYFIKEHQLNSSYSY